MSWGWTNAEHWAVVDAARYVMNGCPIKVAVKTLMDGGTLQHRSESAIRHRLRLIVAISNMTKKRQINAISVGFRPIK